MNLFDIVPQREVVNKKEILDKISKANQEIPTHKGTGPSILNLIQTVKENMDKYMGDKKEDYILITDTMSFVSYCDKIIENGIYAIDTETTGLDPMLDDIVGFSLYTPGMKAMYSPISHISYVTKQPLDNQLPKGIVTEQFRRIVATGAKSVFANAQFDIRFIRHFFGVNITPYFDCLIASKILNENEPSNALKPLYKKYILKGAEDTFKFGELFNGIKFNLVPPNVGYLYAARDAEITYQLYEFQLPFLTVDNMLCKNQSLVDAADVFWNIEMPLIQVVCNMEDTGVAFDFDKQKELSYSYNKTLSEKEQQCYECLKEYSQLIDDYKRVTPDHKLDTPLNLGSPIQLSILLYDILKVPPADKKQPRGTGEDILQKINLPICNAILEYRGFAKLVSTYIDKLIDCVNPNDRRIHCHFNQYGAATGRFSSSNPNLQNIPSHDKSIRKMFKATDGYVLMSSDFSQQEPKCLAALCAKAGDPQMLNTFLAGKDLYSEIAAVSFNTTYEECLEHFPKGSYIKQVDGHWYYGTENDYDKVADGENDTYADGKNRRSQAKSILLGVLYGRGIDSIAEQLNCSSEKAQKIKDDVFNGFPAIKQFEEQSLNMAKSLGYVTTVCGRKRRLPDMQLPDYCFEYTEQYKNITGIHIVPQETCAYLTHQLNKIYGRKKQREFIDEVLIEDSIIVKNNQAFIAQATRQVVNSRIQGSAADLTKLAMIALDNNDDLKKLGFRMLIPVHDEIIAECPEENINACSELLAQTMCSAAEKVLGMPINCDVECTKVWYGENIKIN